MSEKFLLDEVIDPARELVDLLEYNGIRYSREKYGLRCAFSDAACKWETIFQCTQRTVLIYGIYPFPVSNREGTVEKVNRINRELTRGAMFLVDERVVMRTSADLFDEFSAYEAIGRALEYNAGAVVSFWQAMAAAAQ